MPCVRMSISRHVSGCSLEYIVWEEILKTYLQSAFGPAGFPAIATPSQRHESLIAWYLPDSVGHLVFRLDDWQTLQEFLSILQWVALFNVLRLTETKALDIYMCAGGGPA